MTLLEKRRGHSSGGGTLIHLGFITRMNGAREKGTFLFHSSLGLLLHLISML